MRKRISALPDSTEVCQVAVGLVSDAGSRNDAGTDGVGKTALAVHWAHQAAGRFPDGQLYVNLRGYDPDQPTPATDALAGFLRALGVPGQDIPPEVDGHVAPR